MTNLYKFNIFDIEYQPRIPEAALGQKAGEIHRVSRQFPGKLPGFFAYQHGLYFAGHIPIKTVSCLSGLMLEPHFQHRQAGGVYLSASSRSTVAVSTRRFCKTSLLAD